MNGETVMKHWKVFALLLVLALCACGQTSAGTPEAAPETAWDALGWEETLELAYAEQFSVAYAGDGLARIQIDQDTYLLVPEGREAPDGVPEDVVILRQPLENIYLQATAAMDCFRQLDAIDAITMSGTQAEGWYIPEAREAMEAGRMVYAGKYSAPDYELIADRGCDMALESTMIYHTPEVKEQLERLGIPVLVERSSYESHPLGRMEWVKLYGALLNREEEARAYYNEQLARLEPVLEKENTGRTAAFFAITSNGMVTVRKPGDYIAKAIDLAGGVYALKGLSGEENALSTMNIQMESFYDMAKDADILIYNSAIESTLETLDQLVEKSAPLADFKAVQAGNVWCTGKSMFQESQAVGDIITDIHTVVSEEDPADEALTYLRKLT